MSELVTAARPYARAAFEFADEHDAVAPWSRALSALAAIATDDTVARLTRDPRLPTARVADLINDALGDVLGAPPSHHVRNFVRLLAENRRLALAAPLAELFEEYRAAAEQRVGAEIVSAFALDQARQDSIREALSRRMGKDVVVTCRVDASLLAGAVVRVGDWVIDGSLKSSLARLAARVTR